MAGTVRISALTPLTSVTPDDFIIINNANSNTQTVSFDNFVKSVNAVMSVNGYGGPAITLTANDVGSYTTAEVDTLLLGKTDMSTTQGLSGRVDDLVSFVGSANASTIQPNIWKLPALQAASPTEIFSAVKVLDGALEITDLNLVSANLAIADNSSKITNLQGEVDTLETDLQTLEGIVNGTNGLNDGVAANETAIELNATNIDNINAAVGVAAGSYADNISGSIPNTGAIAGATTVTGALTLLNTGVGTNATNIAANSSTLSDNTFTRARMHANTAHIFNKIITACSSLPAGSSANDLATALIAELGNLPNPTPETP